MAFSFSTFMGFVRNLDIPAEKLFSLKASVLYAVRATICGGSMRNYGLCWRKA